MVKRAMIIADTKKSLMKYKAKFTWQQYQSRGVQYPLKSLTTPRRWFPNILWMDTRSSHKSMLKKNKFWNKLFVSLAEPDPDFHFLMSHSLGKKWPFLSFSLPVREKTSQKKHTHFFLFWLRKQSFSMGYIVYVFIWGSQWQRTIFYFTEFWWNLAKGRG